MKLFWPNIHLTETQSAPHHSRMQQFLACLNVSRLLSHDLSHATGASFGSPRKCSLPNPKNQRTAASICLSQGWLDASVGTQGPLVGQQDPPRERWSKLETQLTSTMTNMLACDLLLAIANIIAVASQIYSIVWVTKLQCVSSYMAVGQNPILQVNIPQMTNLV